MKPEQDKVEHVHSDLRLMELAERNSSLGGRDLLRAIIERGAHPEAHDPPSSRDLRAALRPRSLDDSDYRTPVEQAHLLNQASQDLRALYERGAQLKGDTLILPAEAHELAEEKGAPFLTTFAYAEQKIARPEQAKEFHELARTISGETADTRTELTVLKIYYDRLNRDEKGKKLERQDEMGRVQAVERTLSEMRALAQEMAQLETRASVEAEPLPAGKTEGGERRQSTLNVAARIVDLRDESLRFPAGLSFATKERLLIKTLPELDYRLEHGVPRDELYRAIDRRMSQRDSEIHPDKLKGIGGFLKSYLDERLRDPETRALHESAVFRKAHAAILNTRTPAELGRVAEDILRNNQQRSQALRSHLADPAHQPVPEQRPLDARERNLLFFGRAPAHHTPEMRELRIAYGLTKAEREERVSQLRRGEIAPLPALQKALSELDARRTIKAINHFQASLLNERMESAGRINLYQFHQQMPPHEKAYLFELTEQRKRDFQRETVKPERFEPTVQKVETSSPPSASLRFYLAEMGQIERRLLNEAVVRQSGQRAEASRSDLTITEARRLLPPQAQQEIRSQASQRAWEALIPEVTLRENPSTAALRVGDTIALIQEELQRRARVAQVAYQSFERDHLAAQAVTPTVRSEETYEKKLALEDYRAQTRDAVYRGFAQLDEQLGLLAAERSNLTNRVEGTITTGLRENAATQQAWQFDSLRDVLSERLATFGGNLHLEREPLDDRVREARVER